ncbi:MAG: nickel-dependent hydrogenase large subunit [Rhodoferax sp.]
MTAPTPLDSLAGQYTLCPGQTPAIRGQRPVLADGQLTRLLQGQSLPALRHSLGSLFTLCAHAHQDCAERAWHAAQGSAPNQDAGAQTALAHLHTAREHLRCIALEWPQRLLHEAPSLHWLQGCPLPLTSPSGTPDPVPAGERLSALADWLANTVLLQSLDSWLAACQQPSALWAWCQARAATLPPARALASAAALHTLPALPLRRLAPHGAASLEALAQAMWQQSGFCEQPTWGGACAETGPWARWRHADAGALSAWSRLAARWVELVELARFGQQGASVPLLARGALALAPGQGLAWCEMARGLLVHSLSLDAQGRVSGYRVLAPTEWNFHPAGSLAQALRSLSAQDHAQAQRLAAAFDPCVACAV